MTQSTELLPCPVSWCEEPEPRILQHVGATHSVHCGMCGTGTPRYFTEAEAVAAWNTRTTPDRNAVLEVCKAVASAEFLAEESVYQDDDLVMISVGTVRKARAALTTTPEPTDPAGVSGVAEQVKRLAYTHGLVLSDDSGREEPFTGQLIAFADALAALRPSPVLEVAKEALIDAREVVDATIELAEGLLGKFPQAAATVRRNRERLAKIDAALATIKEGEAR